MTWLWWEWKSDIEDACGMVMLGLLYIHQVNFVQNVCISSVDFWAKNHLSLPKDISFQTVELATKSKICCWAYLVVSSVGRNLLLLALKLRIVFVIQFLRHCGYMVGVKSHLMVWWCVGPLHLSITDWENQVLQMMPSSQLECSLVSGHHV